MWEAAIAALGKAAATPTTALPGNIQTGPVTIGGNNAPVWSDPLMGSGTPPAAQVAQAVTQPITNLTSSSNVGIIVFGGVAALGLVLLITGKR